MRWLLAAAALVVLAVAGAAGALLYTEAGLRWAAAQAQAASGGKLRLEGLRGALARDISLSLLQFQDENIRVELRDATASLELLAFLGARAGIRSLEAKSLRIDLSSDTRDTSKSPAPLKVPLGLRVERARIERITLQRGAERYEIAGFELRDAALLHTGAVSASAAFALRHEQYPVSAQLKLGGSLERLEAAFEGRVAEVPAKARAILTPFAPRPLAAIDVETGPLDLQRLNREWPGTQLTLKLSGRSSEKQALAGSLSARNAAPGPLDERRIPLASLEARFSTADLRSALLQELKAALSPGGTVSGQGELRPGVAQFDLRVAELDLRALRSSLHATRLGGSVRLTAGEKQTLQGTLEQDGMRISADLAREGDDVQVRSLRAEARGGAATGSGRLRLGEPMRFDAKLELEHFDPARFGEYPSGDLNGSVEGAGTLGADPVVDARWAIQNSMLRDEAFESRGGARLSRAGASRVIAQASLGGAHLTARGDFGRPGDELGWALQVPRIEHFLESIAGRLEASGTLAGSIDEPRATLVASAAALRLPQGMTVKSARAKASGTLAQHSAELSLQAEGIEIDARLRGGWSQAAGWSGQLVGLRNSGDYPLQLAAPAPLRVAPGRVELGRLEASFAGGRLLVERLAWTEKRLTTKGEFSALPAQWLILAAGLEERARSTLLVDGRWDIASSPLLAGSASLRRSAGDVALVDDGVLALGLQKAELDARFTEGRIEASAQITSKYAAATLKAELAPEPGAPGLAITPRSALAFDARIGAMDLRVLAQPLLTDARLEGRLDAELRGSGTLGKPAIAGTLRGEAIAFEMPPLGVFLRNGQLRATLEGDTLRVAEFSIQGGEGRLTASGSLPLALAQGGARLAWRAERFGLLERPDLRLAVSGSGEAQLADKRISLSGSLRADRGYLELEQDRLPKLGDDVVIVGQERALQAKTARVPLALDLQLDLGDDLEVRGYGLEGKLAGQLQIETTKDGELRAYGRIRTVNATFFAYGQRLQVDPGVAIFDGPLDNPSLQLTAWRRKQQVEVGVQVSGSARAPRVQLVSQPPVPEGERLSWLVLGRAPSDATKADLGLLQAAAGALLARGDKMPLDRRIAQAFGLDEISLRGTGEVTDRVVAVGKRLSDRLYISYEQGLGAAASALVKLDFSLTQRFAVRAETGTSSGLGLFYRFSWD
jgi:translocation and assembly module TamB